MLNHTSVFSTTSRMFENVRASRISRHQIASSSVAQIIESSSRVFQRLDRSDSVQNEISLRLWVLRSSIVFTVLPFDEPALTLLLQADQLRQASSGLPEVFPFLESLAAAVADIVADGHNPKREWLLRMLGENVEIDGNKS